MKNLFISLIICTNAVSAFAQPQMPNVQSPSTTAAQGTAGNFVINYTIGEMVLVNTELSNGLMITQGIMQPVTFIANTNYECFSQTEVNVYPNPNPGVFSLQLSLYKKGNVSIALYDMLGQKILNDAFEYSGFATKQYNISKYANGQYYLQLYFTEQAATKPQKCVYTIQKIN